MCQLAPHQGKLTHMTGKLALAKFHRRVSVVGFKKKCIICGSELVSFNKIVIQEAKI